MPVIAPVLGQLIQQNVNRRMRQMADYSGPLAQKNPAYFIMMCNAIATGIQLGAPVIAFTTTDSGVTSAPPVPGVGTGVGIKVDAEKFAERLYTLVRSKMKARFGDTSLEPWRPPADGAGRFTEALCRGIAESVQRHFATCWILTSAHPIIYMGSGKITKGKFRGVAGAAVAAAIQSAAPLLSKGPAWPIFCQAVGEAYQATIQQDATGEVRIFGVCVPSITQVCAIPASGSGAGTAA
jgi:hypothetical protein